MGIVYIYCEKIVNEDDMDIIKITKKLMTFKTISGNMEEIEKCLSFCGELGKKMGAEVKIFRKKDLSPAILISNTKSKDFDAMVLGHLDVVPADEKMFVPIEKNGKLYGRGALDMKSFAAVAFNTMEYVIKNKLNLKFAVLLSTDEETSSKFFEFKEVQALKPKLVLDCDVAGDVTKIINKCKNPVFVKIVAKGKQAHGSTPWEGIDANENLINTLNNIRKNFTYFSAEKKTPKKQWINTYHVAKISGGQASNIISDSAEALLDFRLVETSSVKELEKMLKKCMVKHVSYEIVSSSNPVVMEKNNPYVKCYKKVAENVLKKPVEFEQCGGATDARKFAKLGIPVIMHSGSGDGMHGKNEFVVIDSVLKFAQIQQNFVELLDHKNR